MNRIDTKVIVSLSGGRDSATCLGLAVDQYGAENVYAIGFEYGSKHPQELEAAQKIADYYGVPYQIISINPSIFSGSGCTLLKGSEKEVQKDMTYAEIMKQNGEGKVDTYVPARNTLFSAYALAKAESISQQFNCEVLIMLGQHADDSGFKVNEKGEEVLDFSKAAYPDAVAKGTKILMATGTLKNIEDIEIGDKIYSFNEISNKFEEATATAFYNKGIKNVYNVANDLWVSENHIMQIRGNKNKKFSPYSHLKNKKAHYKLPYTKYKLYEISNMSNYNKGYLHGFIDGDGWFKYNSNGNLSIGICQKHPEVIDEVINLWQQEYKNKKINKCFKNTHYDYKMVYASLGGKEVIDKYLKDETIEDKDYFLGYLNGLMIAEGWCSYNKSDHSTMFAFCQSLNKNPQICERIDKYISFLEFENISWVDKKNIKTWRFNKAFRFPLTYGSTKKNLLLTKLKEHYSLNHLNSIEMNKLEEANSREEECFDITTTSGTFIANNILVHNCSLEYVNAFAEVARISSCNKVNYWTPFIKNHKWELIKIGMNLKKPVPYELCMSCYDPIQDDKGNWHECGRCATCMDVKIAMAKAMVNN